MPTASEVTACGTMVKYRGVVLNNCETTQFDQEMVMDESDTDVISHKFTIGVSTFVHEQDFSSFGFTGFQNTDSATLEDSIDEIQLYLGHPRGDFEYWDGPYRLLVATHGDPDLQATEDTDARDWDINNGPKTRHVKVTHFAGYKAFKVSLIIEVHKLVCDANLYASEAFRAARGAENRSVLSNRWEITETRDADFFLTRRIAGKLRTAHSNLFPHAFRHLCVPPLQRGYKRERMTFRSSKNNLNLDWEVLDKQRYAAPPRPAIDWTASHTESVQTGGAIGQATISVHLKGALGTPKTQLLAAAVIVIESRIGSLRGTIAEMGERGMVPLSAAFTDHLHLPEIELRVDIKRVPPPGKVIGLPTDDIGTTPPTKEDGETGEDGEDRKEDTGNYNVDMWPNPLPYDSSSPVGLFRCYLQNPCDGNHGLQVPAPQIMQNTMPEPHEEEGEEPEIAVYTSEDEYFQDPPDPEDNVAEEQRESFPYMDIEIESRYEFDYGAVQLPTTKKRIIKQPSDDKGATEKLSLPGTDTAASDKKKEPTAFVTFLHNPICHRIFTIKAERAGEWPQLPPPQAIIKDVETGISEYIATAQIIPHAPELNPMGQGYLYTSEVEYTYLLDRAPEPDEALKVGSYQWDTSLSNENLFKLEEHKNEDIV